MADNSKIEWTDATVNAVNGCTRVSPGCGGPGPFGGCYAERLAGTRLRNHPSRAGLTKQTSAGPRWTGEVSLNETALMQPLAWSRSRRIFWNAHGDLFHDKVPDAWIYRCFAVMALSPQHIHQVLTKRPRRMREFMSSPHLYARVLDQVNVLRRASPRKGWVDVGVDNPTSWRNLWLGTSVEDQQRADERVPHLVATPAGVRFLSCEPLLGPIDLTDITLRVEPGEQPDGLAGLDALTGVHWDAEDTITGIYGSPDPRIDWVIVGGESGPGARPMHPDWARSLRDQCAEAGVPFFLKQLGEWAPGENCDGPMKRTERVAYWFGGEWSYEMMTPSETDGLHVDDEPDVYRIGKKAAGRLLDGVQHDGVPA